MGETSQDTSRPPRSRGPRYLGYAAILFALWAAFDSYSSQELALGPLALMLLAGGAAVFWRGYDTKNPPGGDA
ncbi:hypothetical protein [Maricaulis sp.]|uniref:hypothetical protein n=1 Tax=Maricaulis sp. TaxID=1486257 RepID=UPI002627A0CA|nr:hypothetical protein [Maricaulis sp.]